MGETKYYVFTVLPFGLSTACYLFTKLLRPLIRHWQGSGLKAILYLDDGIVAVKGRDNAVRESARVKQDLESAGLVVNIEKSVWEPTHSLEWLGLIIDLKKGEFLVPQAKLEALKVKLSETRQAKSMPAKQIA